MPLLMSKGGDGAQYALRPGINRLGRNPSNDWQINDGSISGAHCEVIVDSDSVRVRDLDSTNGTYIDDMLVREAFLREGQTLRLGSCRFCFIHDPKAKPPAGVRISQRPAAPPTPPPAANLPVPPIATGVAACANHPAVAAAYVCKKCGGKFCASCVNEQTVARTKLRFCRACGEECVSLREPTKAKESDKTFFQRLPDAFRYPFKRDGLILLVAGTLFFGFFDFLLNGPHFGTFFVAGYVLILQVFALGYLLAYLKSVIATSAYGDESMPKWPEFSNFGDDIIFPCLLMGACLLACFGPTFLYMYYVDYTLPGWERVGFVALLGLGCITLPMAVLAVFMHETVFALNPLLLVVSMLRVPGEYLVTCVVFGFIVGLQIAMNYLAETLRVIPVLPTLLNNFLSLYLLCVEMRILGLLFHTNRKRLGWSMS